MYPGLLHRDTNGHTHLNVDEEKVYSREEICEYSRRLEGRRQREYQKSASLKRELER